LFRRIDANLIIGLKQNQQSGLAVDDLNLLQGIRTHHGEADGRRRSSQKQETPQADRYFFKAFSTSSFR